VFDAALGQYKAERGSRPAAFDRGPTQFRRDTQPGRHVTFPWYRPLSVRPCRIAGVQDTITSPATDE